MSDDAWDGLAAVIIIAVITTAVSYWLYTV